MTRAFVFPWILLAAALPAATALPEEPGGDDAYQALLDACIA